MQRHTTSPAVRIAGSIVLGNPPRSSASDGFKNPMNGGPRGEGQNRGCSWRQMGSFCVILSPPNRICCNSAAYMSWGGSEGRWIFWCYAGWRRSVLRWWLWGLSFIDQCTGASWLESVVFLWRLRSRVSKPAHFCHSDTFLSFPRRREGGFTFEVQQFLPK